MISPFIPHVILAGLVGIQCGSTDISKVSVKVGGSISIPCLYEPNYTDHEKYLCSGMPWLFCSIKVRTNRPQNSGKFSIADDTNQTVFTVTINDVTQENDGNWWCAVDRRFSDIKKKIQLSVTKDEPILYVDKQEVEAFEGGSVTVVCYYKSQKVTGWCRLGNPRCVTRQTGSISGATVTINASLPQVFNVTMSDLRTESSGWYFCTDGQLQIPVNVIVHESTSATTTATTMSPSVSSALPTSIQHSSLLTSAEPLTAQATDSTTNDSGEDEHRSSTLITTLVVLLLLIPAAFLGWWMIRRRKSKPGGSDIPACLQTGSDPDMHYSTIVHNKDVAAQKKDCTPEESVMYSTIVRRDTVQQMTEPADVSVIYSTIVKKK
ncbi:polymeric immunoglobulin receptor-like isoform X2 [Acanthopagrus latus]|uniref:polymeric immunoglobulin receptor-like isoform X2 n=1 Tax=Acanthopagrus latus TaxID=8177 RepID=UPI00187C7717|nr:polymeric immunoglobulin receptor-like isoform X2 [Acanthopagrus latus]